MDYPSVKPSLDHSHPFNNHLSYGWVINHFPAHITITNLTKQFSPPGPVDHLPHLPLGPLGLAAPGRPCRRTAFPSYARSCPGLQRNALKPRRERSRAGTPRPSSSRRAEGDSRGPNGLLGQGWGKGPRGQGWIQEDLTLFDGIRLDWFVIIYY